jgi:hypothetical protein
MSDEPTHAEVTAPTKAPCADCVRAERVATVVGIALGLIAGGAVAWLVLRD